MDVEKKINQLQDKIDKRKDREKRSEDRDAFQRVFDSRTIETLQKFLRNLKIEEIIGIISQGKEANVFFAYGANRQPVAIKIYKIDIQSARWMKKYIKGDPRFKKIGKSPDKVIFAWCKKEYRNLKQIYDRTALYCPEPLYSRNNILIMTYIGDPDGTPARKLKDMADKIEDPVKELNTTLEIVKNLYRRANLVHADLSEFNILYYKEKQYVIDVSQAVSTHHPKALLFLSRDIANCIDFYKRFNIQVPDPLEVYRDIIGVENNK